MSAMNLLVPSYTGVFPVASPVTAGQRQAVAWVYSGIAAAAAAAAQNFTANLFKAIAERFTFRSSAIDGGFTFKAFTDVFTFGSVASEFVEIPDLVS